MLSTADYMAEQRHECKWNEMDTKSGHDKIQGTILAFIWRHWGKPWTPSPNQDSQPQGENPQTS